MTFGDLEIAYDDRVLTPRPWTALQSQWAASIADGPMLELCSGAGHIGLLACRLSGQRLVCVDFSAAACDLARRNAASAGLDELVEVREGDLSTALEPDEHFSVVIADPPWVCHDGIGRFPEDPVTAIDGGPDGLDIARACARVAGRHLAPGGALLLQLGELSQVDALARELTGVVLTEVRRGAGGVVARLDSVVVPSARPDGTTGHSPTYV